VVEPQKFNGNLYHISKISHERALVSSRSYTAYATAVLDDYFKPSVSLFCTCSGSLKGRGADGNERASLPKEALEVFLGKRVQQNNTLFTLCVYPNVFATYKI
jgi:hypothetical protein